MAYVMVLDDDKDYGDAVAKVLREDGHEVEVELDIDDAVKSMEARQPDLLILDVMFPEDNSAGFKFARAVQHRDEKLKNIPVLMLTAVNADSPVSFSAHDIDDTWLPVSDFLDKTADFDVLRGKVNALLGA